jgi:geranylgeranyl pyrophosphate synthase
MKFEEYIGKHKENVYNKICEYIPDREPVEHYKMTREYVDRKGKYTRPSFLLLWTELHGGDVNKALLPAAAMQASEDWVLIHDDIQDNNRTRRGQPAAWVKYGVNYSMNAGDALHMIMWRMAYDAANNIGGEIGKKYYEKFNDILIVTAEGQYLDMRLAHDVKDITKFTLEDYYRSIHAKAAYYSVYGPMQMGAIIAGKDDAYVNKIKEYGKIIGNAFQIKDDILDCTATEEVLGKTPKTDIYENVKTSILWHFVKNANEIELEKVKKIYSKDREEKTPEEVQEVLDLFNSYGSIKYAEAEVDKMAKDALTKFEEISKDIPESDLKDTARDAIKKMVERKK